jgi:hypothetical protein
VPDRLTQLPTSLRATKNKSPVDHLDVAAFVDPNPSTAQALDLVAILLKSIVLGHAILVAA